MASPLLASSPVLPTIDPSVISLVSAVTALTASIIGPLVALYVARLQVRATVRSANRQKWIEEFRDTVASFCGQIAAATQLRETLQADGRVRASNAEVLGCFERVVATSAKIRLLVNPADAGHEKMVATVDELLTLFTAAPAGEDVQVLAKAMALEIAAMSLAVIRQEWTRVLRGT